jgi:tetratricopeptide (TPR) repeat protein
VEAKTMSALSLISSPVRRIGFVDLLQHQLLIGLIQYPAFGFYQQTAVLVKIEVDIAVTLRLHANTYGGSLGNLLVAQRRKGESWLLDKGEQKADAPAPIRAILHLFEVLPLHFSRLTVDALPALVAVQHGNDPNLLLVDLDCCFDSQLTGGYQAAGAPEQALPLFEEAAMGIEKQQFQYMHAGRLVGNLADCYERLKQFDRAETWRRKWLAVVREHAGTSSIAFAAELDSVSQNLLLQKKWPDAESLLRDSLAIREELEPRSWATANTKSLLGSALLWQDKHADAERILIAGYEGLKADEQAIPRSARRTLPHAIQQLIAFLR